MADITATKKATALAADTSVDGNDAFLVADAGTATLKRLLWTRILAAIKAAISEKKTKTVTNAGLTAIIYESPVAIRIKISGTTTGSLGTSTAYASFGQIATTGLKPVVKKISPRTGWEATLRVNAEDNKVQVGYTVQNGAAANIPSGTALYVDETIMIV